MVPASTSLEKVSGDSLRCIIAGSAGTRFARSCKGAIPPRRGPQGLPGGWQRRSVMKAAKQTTVRDSITLDGIGVHSGARVSVTLHPAEAGSGIAFLRSDQDHAESPLSSATSPPPTSRPSSAAPSAAASPRSSI